MIKYRKFIIFGIIGMKWIYKLEYKYGRKAIENLMYYIVGGMAVVFVMDIILSNTGRVSSLYELLMFDRDLIFSGQVWRIISFIFLPPDSSMLFIVFALYFYYMIGTSLENAWSSFKFNVYYFMGVICTIIFGFVTGYTTNIYLNMSLFFAFAMLFPDYKVLLFFVLPVKIKYLAYIDAAFFIIELIIAPWAYKIALLVAIGNFLLFFMEDFIKKAKDSIAYIKSKHNYK